MMKRSRNIIILIVIFLLFLTMACEDISGVKPDDERIQDPVDDLVVNLGDFLSNMGSILDSDAPFIRYVVPIKDLNDGSGEWEYEITVESTDFNYIGIFEVTPNGCKKPYFTNAKLNSIIDNPNNRLSRIIGAGGVSGYIRIEPGSFITVAGTNDPNDGFGVPNENIRVVSENEIWEPVLISPNPDNFVSNSHITISGEAYPGMCIVLTINDDIADEQVVNDNSVWQFDQLLLFENENDIQIKAKGLDKNTAHELDINLKKYVPLVFSENSVQLIPDDEIPNLWRIINNNDLIYSSYQNNRNAMSYMQIVYQFDVESKKVNHSSRYKQGSAGSSSSRCNIFAGDVAQALNIPFPTKNDVNCCGGGNMWIGPEYMYDWMSGKKRGIDKIDKIWDEWGKWEIVYDASNKTNNNFEKLLNHLREGKPAFAATTEHIAVLLPIGLPDEITGDNVLDLLTAQAGMVNSNQITLKKGFGSEIGELRIFIHE